MACKRVLLFLAGWLAFTAHAGLPIQSWQTPNGARVLFVENHDLPLLDIGVTFAAGSARNVPGQAGLAALTHGMLSLGAGGRSEDEIARSLADVGAVLGGGFDRDSASVTLRTLSQPREKTQALDVLADVLHKPAFPQAVFERQRANTIAFLKDEDTRPDGLLGKTFMAALYGAHPYGLHPAGTPETLATLRRDDLVAFYRTHYTAPNAVIALIGDIDRAEAAVIATRLAAGLPTGAALPELPAPARLERAETRVVPHHATQSHIMVGNVGIRRGDPDYFALFVGNHILGGGGFTSRLMQEVREKRGLVYGVGSYFEPMQVEGPFRIVLQTKREQSDEALGVVRDTLARFLANGPSPDELEKAKRNIMLGFPLRIDSNAEILGYLGLIGFYRLPLTYLDDFVGEVGKVRGEDVRAAFARRLSADRMLTVVVGPTDGKAE